MTATELRHATLTLLADGKWHAPAEIPVPDTQAAPASRRAQILRVLLAEGVVEANDGKANRRRYRLATAASSPVAAASPPDVTVPPFRARLAECVLAYVLSHVEGGFSIDARRCIATQTAKVLAEESPC